MGPEILESLESWIWDLGSGTWVLGPGSGSWVLGSKSEGFIAGGGVRQKRHPLVQRGGLKIRCPLKPKENGLPGLDPQDPPAAPFPASCGIVSSLPVARPRGYVLRSASSHGTISDRPGSHILGSHLTSLRPSRQEPESHGAIREPGSQDLSKP